MKYKKVETRNGLEFHLIGSFSFKDHDEFFDLVKDIKTTEYKNVYLDFSECDFLDSAALGMIVIAHDEASFKDIDIKIKGANGRVKNVLYAARFDTLYDFED